MLKLVLEKVEFLRWGGPYLGSSIKIFSTNVEVEVSNFSVGVDSIYVDVLKVAFRMEESCIWFVLGLQKCNA